MVKYALRYRYPRKGQRWKTADFFDTWGEASRAAVEHEKREPLTASLSWEYRIDKGEYADPAPRGR